MTPAILAALSVVAIRSPNPITLIVIGELVARIVVAQTPVETYLATYDAALYASGALKSFGLN